MSTRRRACLPHLTLIPPHSRYLRARKFSPPEALKQFKDTEDWRKENSLAELYDTIDVTEYEETRRLVSSASAQNFSALP